MNESHDQFEVATLAGGCFWGVQELFRAKAGVVKTEVGYTGGHTQDPTYEDVKTGNTGHAEAIQIRFDKRILSFKDLLRFFFRLHDPTTKNRQGNDIGTQYRSAIFVHSPKQDTEAREVIAEINASGFWKKPIVTEIAPYEEFCSAEDYHQDYLQKNPGGYTCHFIR